MKKAVEVRLGKGYDVREMVVEKNNGVKLEALVVRRDGRKLSPTIYLQSFYDRYSDGESIKDCSKSFVESYYDALPPADPDVYFYNDFETVRERICYKLISAKRNAALLEKVPHVPFLDLAIVFYYPLEADMFSNASILIRDSHAENWGTCTEELMREACRNTPKVMPVRFSKMCDVLSEMNPEMKDYPYPDEISQMYVLSNEYMHFGAAAIMYPEMLDEISDKLDSDLFIIPSSVHEVIVIPEGLIKDREYLMDMIFEINRTQVDPQDVLSDWLYRYDRSERKVTEVAYPDIQLPRECAL